MSGRSFSVRELRARLDPDASEAAVRDRLDDLRDRGIVAAETYPASTTLFYVDPPRGVDRSTGTEPCSRPNPLDRLSARDFLSLRDPAGVRTVVLAGYQLSLVLFVLGVVLSVGGLDALVSSSHGLWTAAGNLLAVCIGLRIADRIATRVRKRHGGA